MGCPVTTRTAEYPRPNHFLLHISDTHLLAGGGKLYGSVESEQLLRGVFDELEASGGRPEAIVFTGDLADKGEPDAYDRIRSIVEPVAAMILEIDSVDGQRGRPSTLLRFDLLKVVGSRPAFLARPDGDKR